jgi:pyruvate dehydrogenase E1 component beta subunit
MHAEVVDLRVLNPLDPTAVVASVRKTGRLLVVDGGWSSCGMAAEVIASVAERLPAGALKKAPVRITLPAAPAPTSRVLEATYYPSVETVVAAAGALVD